MALGSGFFHSEDIVKLINALNRLQFASFQVLIHCVYLLIHQPMDVFCFFSSYPQGQPKHPTHAFVFLGYITSSGIFGARMRFYLIDQFLSCFP